MVLTTNLHKYVALVWLNRVFSNQWVKMIYVFMAENANTPGRFPSFIVYIPIQMIGFYQHFERLVISLQERLQGSRQHTAAGRVLA